MPKLLGRLGMFSGVNIAAVGRCFRKPPGRIDVMFPFLCVRVCFNIYFPPMLTSGSSTLRIHRLRPQENSEGHPLKGDTPISIIQDSIYPASSHSKLALPICQLFRASPRSLHFPAAINSSNMEVDDRRALKGHCLTKTPQHFWLTLPHATNFPRLLGRSLF